MSLLKYESLFSKLNPNRTRDHVSPHKIAMLLAVSDLIEAGIISENRIEYSDALIDAFTKRFDSLKGPQDRNSPHLPFFHLRNEGFWHHQINPGQTESYSQLTTVSNSGAVLKNIAFAQLDDELFELLRNYAVRELLKTSLYLNLEITNEKRRNILNVGDGWDWLECEACVADYFLMLQKELRREKYSKAEHRRLLKEKALTKRSEGSIEFKHQNISAVLIRMGFPYISGYKPRFNYQAQLYEAVLAHLAGNQLEIDNLNSTQDVALPTYVTNWDKVLDNDIPELIPPIVIPDRKYLAKKPNYSKLEANNRSLGEYGEKFVVEFERYRLQRLGRSDLANEVEWRSKDQGDGLGYDVRSFSIENDVVKDDEHFIEVKTTNSGKYQPFFITANELAFSEAFSKHYSLYRVYDFKEQVRLFQMQGAVKQFVNLKPELFKASFTK